MSDIPARPSVPATPAVPAAPDALPHRSPVVYFGAVLLVLFGAATLAPLWAPILFALWTATLMEPLAARVTRLARGRRSLGAAVCVLVVMSLLVPVVLMLVSLGTSAYGFVRQILASPAARGALVSIVSPEGEAAAVVGAPAAVATRAWPSLDRWIELAQSHGGTALRATREFAGVGASASLAVFVFLVCLYAQIDEGAAFWRWVEDHSPLSPKVSRRLAAAFHETGRGMIIGAGLTSLAQALVASAAYAALGVPRVPVLGAITFVAAFVPVVGTAAVWAPVALGLALTGSIGKALILAAIGAFGIGTIDNLLRPAMQRWGGHLDLPATLLLLAAFGGLQAFGPAGLALGPLALRMAREVLEIAREARATDASPAED